MEHQLISHIRAKHNCHTLILYGSRARGDFTDASDWDCVGICESGQTYRDAGEWNGSFLDAFIEPESHFEVLNPGHLRLREGKVLFQKDSFGDQLLQRISQFYAAGPAPLAYQDIHFQKVWAEKMLARVAEGNSADCEANYRLVWLLHELLEQYFTLRRLWFSGSKLAFMWLQENDPKFLAIYKDALSDPFDLSKLKTAVDHVHRV